MSKRTVAVINLEAIRHNVMQISEKVADKKLMAVVKADGYGHGGVRVANAVSDLVHSFAVATVQEGLELREAKIEQPILLLGIAPDEEIALCVERDISLTVSDFEMAKVISDEAVSLGKQAKIHLAVDTGMNRIGFSVDQKNISEIKKIQELPMTEIMGIFTHYAAADTRDKRLCIQQMELFDNFCDKLKDAGIKVGIRHVANSGFITDFDYGFHDMVRSGIIIYGLYPSDEVNKDTLHLMPALEWKSRVSMVKEVEAGSGISYGHTFIADKKMKIATISVGYGDGYPRLMSNCGRVLINGEYHNIVGRVCMDQVMVDVTDSNVQKGDEVVLIGKSGDKYISADEIANNAKTINYEIVCGIGKRVERIYI